MLERFRKTGCLDFVRTLIDAAEYFTQLLAPFFGYELVRFHVCLLSLPPLALQLIHELRLGKVALRQDQRVVLVELVQRRLLRLVAAVRIDCRLEEALPGERVSLELDGPPFPLEAALDVYLAPGLVGEPLEDWAGEPALLVIEAGQVGDSGDLSRLQCLLRQQGLLLAVVEASDFRCLRAVGLFPQVAVEPKAHVVARLLDALPRHLAVLRDELWREGALFVDEFLVGLHLGFAV